MSREYEEEGKSSSWHEEEKEGRCCTSVVASVALSGMFVALSLGTCAEKISRTCWGSPKPSDLCKQRKDLRGWKGEGDVCFRDKFSLHKTLVHTLQLVEHVSEPFEVDRPSRPSSTC